MATPCVSFYIVPRAIASFILKYFGHDRSRQLILALIHEPTRASNLRAGLPARPAGWGDIQTSQRLEVCSTSCAIRGILGQHEPDGQ
jgi:hypothetical protein